MVEEAGEAEGMGTGGGGLGGPGGLEEEVRVEVGDKAFVYVDG